MHQKVWRKFWLHSYFVITLFGLAACTSYTGRAPVVNGAGTYRVAASDTLYSIAFAYGVDYRALAQINHIPPPYHLYPGQRLLLRSGEKKFQNQRVFHPKRLSNKVRKAKLRTNGHRALVRRWKWPAEGKIVAPFSQGMGGNKGVDIAGYRGELVRAAAPGKVVYSGNGLRSYGNLIIIKHNNQFLSAYAHNQKILVKEGQFVKLGQRIALMGSSGVNRVVLHFEIRRNGRPMNPMRYLPKA